MATQPERLAARTKQFAIRIVRLFKSLPKNDEARIIGKQLLGAGTSVAANYRAVCRSRSKAEFISRMSVVVEEADETAFWLELLIGTSIIPEVRLRDLLTEANELLAIFAASLWTARQERKTQSVNVSMTR
jgi:four helix bundle protein